MAWIESHQTLGNHPKLIRLAATLKIQKAQAVGHLHYLWWWALDYAPSGDLAKITHHEIADASKWDGDPKAFQDALMKCGWLEEDFKLHDWYEYAGRLIDARKRDAKRKRDIRRTSGGHPADGGGTQPNSTQPKTPRPKVTARRLGTTYQVLP